MHGEVGIDTEEVDPKFGASPFIVACHEGKFNVV
eukprot:SAG11_NODE_8652_length_991_cov_0.828475_2_plen_33_part_01